MFVVVYIIPACYRYGQRFIGIHRDKNIFHWRRNNYIPNQLGHHAHNINYTNRLHGKCSEGLIGKLVSVLIDTFININTRGG